MWLKPNLLTLQDICVSILFQIATSTEAAWPHERLRSWNGLRDQSGKCANFPDAQVGPRAASPRRHQAKSKVFRITEGRNIFQRLYQKHSKLKEFILRWNETVYVT